MKLKERNKIKFGKRYTIYSPKVQGDRLDMAVCFWYLVKIDLSLYAIVQPDTEQDTFHKVPETHGHVKLVLLLLSNCYGPFLFYFTFL